MDAFTSFDGIRIAYHDEGEGPAVILLHGGYVDGLGQFGDFERILPLLEKPARDVPGGVWGSASASRSPSRGKARHGPRTTAAGARTILPDMRGFGASDKPREKTAYANSAMARDVVALVDHLRVDAVDVIRFSMGAGAARVLLLRPPR
jgi:pimeloyl-ACP methyl ester carboxylesterase